MTSNVSVRGLQEGFESPLRRFRGKFEDYVTEPATGYEGTRISLNFSSVVVIQSTEPYNFPIAVINLGLSTRKKSRWGYLASSMADLIPATEDIVNQKGKIMELVFADGQDGRPEPKLIYSRDAGGEVPTSVWLVQSIEGASKEEIGKTIIEIAEKILDGKTMPQFNQEILSHPVVQTKTKEAVDFQKAILNRSFLQGAIASGKFKVDESGVYRKV